MTNNKINRIDKEMQKTREKITDKGAASTENRGGKPANRPDGALHAPDPAGAFPAFAK